MVLTSKGYCEDYSEAALPLKILCNSAPQWQTGSKVPRWSCCVEGAPHVVDIGSVSYISINKNCVC